MKMILNTFKGHFVGFRALLR